MTYPFVVKGSALAFAGAVSWERANLVAIKQQVRATWGLSTVNLASRTKRMRAWTENGGFPYAVVYRIPAEAGSRTTLVMTYPADKAQRRVVIAGENPCSDERSLIPAVKGQV